MFKKIGELEPGDLFVISHFSNMKSGRVIHGTGQSVKVEITYFKNYDIRKEGVKNEIRYISPYRFVFKIN